MSFVYNSPPEKFSPKMEVSSCHCFANNKLLLLQTNSQKTLANLWGVPAGKLTSGESAKNAILREMFEETGIKLSSKNIIFVKTAYVKYPDFDFVYHMFKSTFAEETKNIKLSPEHQSFKWATIEEASSMNLIPGEYECIKLFFEK